MTSPVSIKISLTVIIICLFHKITSARNSGEILIHGELRNFKDRVVGITLKWDYEGKHLRDSCMVRNSRYVFRTRLTEPTIFSLQAKYISKKGEVFYRVTDDLHEMKGFFLGPGKIKLTSTGSFTNMTCSESKPNIAFEKYGRSLRTDSEVDYEVNKIFHSLYVPKADSLETKEKIENSLSLGEDVKYFKKNARSPLGPYLLNSLYNQGYPINGLKKLYTQLSDKCKMTYSAISLLKKLNDFTPLITGQRFDRFALPDTAGNLINVSDLLQKLILIDFWASWCSPCREQMEQLKQIYSGFHDKGFEVVSVSLDEKSDNWKRAIINDRLPWINVSDLTGWNNALIVRYNIKQIPYNILVDNKGKIIAIDEPLDDLGKKCTRLMSTL